MFPVKYRKALLDERVVGELKSISLQIQERYEIEIESLGCDGDHVHLLCGSHPKYAPGQLVRVYKSVTAKELFRRVPGLRTDLWEENFGVTATMPQRWVNEEIGRL